MKFFSPFNAYSLQKEEEVRQFWKKKNIKEKARRQSAKCRKTFYLPDGPPYATGHIHLGTALNKSLKDVFYRSQRMQNKNVFDRAVYDSHGLPIENKVEKELGFASKEDIETYGVKAFVEKCRAFATRHIGVMNNEFDNLGVWMDFENARITLENDYIESVWWTFKKAHEKKLLYHGTYPVHACPRCATAVAFNEIVYAKQTDTAVYVKFPVKGKENTFLLIWTTTPWTLPANTGIMAHPAMEYAEVQVPSGEKWILAKERLEHARAEIGTTFTVTRMLKGSELNGWKYENPLSRHLALPPLENAYRVVLNERYVNLDEGTGLVHTAPGHGKEDFDAGKKAGLPVVAPVELNGTFKSMAGKYAGKKARAVDKEIIEDLRTLNVLAHAHAYTHDYPLCWRCSTPLLMLSSPQWFFKVTAFQPTLIRFNEEVNWVPSWAKDRMRNWLESLGDWPVSRKRYWGTPLPIWVCQACAQTLVIGSLKELAHYAKLPKKMDLHKPGIDEIAFACTACKKGTMKRVPEVLDVWFDAGASSWAELDFPKNEKTFKKFWPADLNLEGKDQIRGWWNAQLILSTIGFEKKPFKSIVLHGMILDANKRKMAKSLGNIVTPEEVIQKYNRDYLRHFLVRESRGEDFNFDWKALEDIHRFYNTLANTHVFARTYLNVRNAKIKPPSKGLQAEDQWITSRLHETIETCMHAYNAFTPYKVLQCIEQFVVEDLSRTYVKLVRDRVQGKTRKGVEETLTHCLLNTLLLLAPVAPHFTEALYQDLQAGKLPESIHLLALPKTEKKRVNASLNKEMETVKEIAQATLNVREEHKLRLRWSLEELAIEAKNKPVKRLNGVLKEMCNVKKITHQTQKPTGLYASKELKACTIHLNTSASHELKDEWEYMELRRKVQDLRKQKKLNPSQVVRLYIQSSDEAFLAKYKKPLEKETRTKVLPGQGPMEKLLERNFYVKLGDP